MAVKLGNGNWAVKEDKLLAYNDNSGRFFNKEFDFARGSIATYVAKDGLIKSAASDVPRIDFSDSTNGALLLEGQRTNNILYSNDISQTFNAQDITETQNYGVAPNGNNESTRVQTTSSTSHYWKNYSLINGSQYTTSFYYKGVKGETTYLRALTTGGGSGNIKLITFNGDWQREELTFTAGSATNYIYVTDNRAGGGNTATDFEVWGGQLEQGSYATSYIPSLSGSATTRLADVCNNSGSAQDFNSEEGVLYAEIAALASIVPKQRIALSDGTDSNRVYIQNSTINNQIQVSVQSGGVSSVNKSTTAYDTTQFNKIAISYKTNDFSFWVNGTKIATDTSVVTPIGLNELAFDDGNGNNPFYGKTKDIQVFTKAKSDEFLAALTTI